MDPEWKEPTRHTPRGHERLDEAYRRDVESHGPRAREAVRQALAEGDIVALFVTDDGEVVPVPARMWTKPDFAKKVYPCFGTGQMRFWLDREKKTDKPWGDVFVPTGSLRAVIEGVVSETQSTEITAAEPVHAKPYHTGSPGRPTIKYQIEKEFLRRVETEQARPSLADEARELRAWAAAEHPEAPTPTEKTIKNNIRALHRKPFPK